LILKCWPGISSPKTTVPRGCDSWHTDYSGGEGFFGVRHHGGVRRACLGKFLDWGSSGERLDVRYQVLFWDRGDLI
jgi:hypothetical protein